MKKSLIALAVASAFVAPAAMADVSMYGTADMSIGSSSNGINSATQISSNTTKFGIKGSEDLGGGLAAVWQIEQQVDIDNAGATNTNSGAGKNTLATRNSFLGLKSDSMGTVLMGTHDTPYKLSTRHMDVFGDGIGDNRALMGKNHDSRLGNVIAYVSPSMSGFSAAVAYVAGAELSAEKASAGTINTKGDAFSLAVMYDVDALKVHFGYQNAKFGDAGTGSLGNGNSGDRAKAAKLGVGYTFGQFTVNGIYEHLSSTGTHALANNALGRNDWTVNGIYKMDNDAVKLAYVKAGNLNNVANSGARQYSIGYDHGLSKHTTIYGVYSNVSNDTAASFGLADTSTGNPTAAAAAGKSVNAFGIGIKHSF